jgi:hypothetical protein
MAKQIRKIVRLLLLVVLVVSCYVQMVLPAKAAGVCIVVERRNGMFMKLLSDPGGDGAIYAFIDGSLITWTDKQGTLRYITADKTVPIYVYDADGELECSG